MSPERATYSPQLPRRAVEALVVDGQLALEIHVVERRHPLRADDREAPLLVRVEPGQVHVGSEARREAHEAEHDVLDAGPDVGSLRAPRARTAPRRRVEHHGDVVCAEAPQRVLVRAQLAQVQAVGVDVVDVAELAGVDDLLELPDAWVYSSRCPTISVRPVSRCASSTRLASAAVRASGFSRKQCLTASSTRVAAQRAIGTGVATTTASRWDRPAGPRIRP